MHLFTSLSLLSLAILPSTLVMAALDQSQMAAHLAAAQQLLGTFETSSDPMASWMSSAADSSPIQSLSIPGTHDSLTWNVSGIAAAFTKTQDLPLFKQLDAGVRFIDLRVGDDNGQVKLYHSTVLLDETAQLTDIFWGVYNWLDAHPTETVIVSVKVDEGNSTQTLEQTIYDAVTGQDVANYWVQSTTFPTLGEARHKAILLRRFAFDLLTNITPIGIDASSGWSDNNAAFTIAYDSSNADAVLNIEDLYDLTTATDLASAVDAKASAISTNLDLATGGTLPNQMFITFASGYSGIIVTPQSLAEGNGTNGVNEKVLEYLASHRGDRFGVVMFDFIGSDTRLAEATLSQEVNLSATPSGSSPTGTYSSSSPNGAGKALEIASGGAVLVMAILSATAGFTLF